MSSRLIRRQEVVDALKQVIFFAKKDNIVNLNMIDDIEIKGDEIKVTIVFPKLDDPAVGIIYNSVVKVLKQELGDDVKVDVKPVSEADKGRGPLSGVKNIIAVNAGKGGVGKSTAAANLAVSLKKLGYSVGILDADIMGPSIPIMFDVEGGQPGVYEKEGKPVMIPLENYGIKILSLGFFVKPDQALMWRGSMINNAFNQLMKDSDWGNLDFLVIDMPPGTGDIQLTLAQSYPVRGIITITTPQKVAAADVRRAAMMYRQDKLTIPLLGIIENMSYFTPKDCPDHKYYIFGQGATEQLADELGIPILGKVPIVEEVVESGDKGKPLALEDDNVISKVFEEIAKNVVKQIEQL
jgi:ATP-binding protein involved in chromosome partitioning